MEKLNCKTVASNAFQVRIRSALDQLAQLPQTGRPPELITTLRTKFFRRSAVCANWISSWWCYSTPIQSLISAHFEILPNEIHTYFSNSTTSPLAMPHQFSSRRDFWRGLRKSRKKSQTASRRFLTELFAFLKFGSTRVFRMNFRIEARPRKIPFSNCQSADASAKSGSKR